MGGKNLSEVSPTRQVKLKEQKLNFQKTDYRGQGGIQLRKNLLDCTQ